MGLCCGDLSGSDSTGAELVLHKLHETHPRIPCIKGLARGYMWGPELEAEIIESMVSVK